MRGAPGMWEGPQDLAATCIRRCLAARSATCKRSGIKQPHRRGRVNSPGLRFAVKTVEVSLSYFLSLIWVPLRHFLIRWERATLTFDFGGSTSRCTRLSVSGQSSASLIGPSLASYTLSSRSVPALFEVVSLSNWACYTY